MERKKTTTSNFGVSKRESHDASSFYERFERPILSTDSAVAPPRIIPTPLVVGDARTMDQLVDGEVALVVTSPPYFAGKQYEEELERNGVPSSYAEYLTLLSDVFDECRRVLEPGGRIAVNVANLGRKPYRSLGSDVIDILQRMGLLMRGEVVWRKGEGASGSCAWGSYRSPANPVLRDLTERVVIASKGRFDRALKPFERQRLGLPSVSSITADEFMAATLDVWEIAPESATRVNHPAPFPVALPERLIHLYTYHNDLVLDPFMGSGSAMVAAARTGRRFVGYDLDQAYVDIAAQRVAQEGTAEPPRPAQSLGAAAEAMITMAGFTILQRKARIRGSGTSVSYTATDTAGAMWWFDVCGANTSVPNGVARADLAWRTVGRAAALCGTADRAPLVVLTSHLPRRSSEADGALRSAPSRSIHDVVQVGSVEGAQRLAAYGTGWIWPMAGFWSAKELSAR